jgi:hypothetical protein
MLSCLPLLAKRQTGLLYGLDVSAEIIQDRLCHLCIDASGSCKIARGLLVVELLAHGQSLPSSYLTRSPDAAAEGRAGVTA